MAAGEALVRRLAAEPGVLEGDPVDLGLPLCAAAHGVAALLVARPDVPWPGDLDGLPLPALLERLDRG